MFNRSSFPSRRGVAATLAGLPFAGAAAAAGSGALAADLAGLTDITTRAKPIDTAERAARLARAQTLMRQAGIGAIVIEPGSSMVYFTGVFWHRSERVTLAILPATGEPCLVTPFFERPSVEQTLGIPVDIRVWQEDENPFSIAAAFLTERDLAKERLGMEETVRFFIADGLARVMPHATIVSADPVVRGCRMVKTAAEIALMQAATDVTIAAYRNVHPRVRAGMTNHDIAAMMDAATTKLGGSPEFSLVLVGPAAALPHGSRAPQVVADGAIVLMDCGCTVQGYQSDVSRTFVFGTASEEQRRVWNQVAKGQQIAFAAARIGAAAGSVDDAVRGYYASLGYGPGYRLPGLSHRTGHGIGLDGHEPVNLVHGERTPLAPGMCFSDEPGLYLPGRFGVRLEDCFHMTGTGPRWFSTPPVSIDQPV
ncbi:Xaa-Pro peptidase family protein [uncultured Sphingomonas sp.]|uniref:M24 family metallopeptidase n=1 Tax=Sphingomonas bacterium TaxID=1895847 RepID=UPI001576A8DC